MNKLRPYYPWILCSGVTLVVALGTITAFCGLIFQCGCTLTAGMKYCNVHNPQGPHCPWCSHGNIGFYVPFAIILAATLATITWALGRFRGSIGAGLLAGMIGYFLWGSLVGLATALYWNYPYFCFWRL